MGKIHVLDQYIANQIAAGEVVERPASIVKELVENSIDAGSSEITINVLDGGLSAIQIKDNGQGIAPEDVEKAFLRHATSKIKSAKDLLRVKSLGFRGEALPSIAAVSKVTLRTSDTKTGQGLEVYLEGGKILSTKQLAFNQGTEIVVEEIFYNTPARLKYLKSLQTELGHIIDYVNRLSLAYPQIAFSLTHNNNLILRTNGDNQLLHVISAIYGTSVAKGMVSFEKSDMDFRIFGFFSKPEITRANKSHISIYINGRYIKNYLITHSIIKGFKDLLMVNRFPITVIHISMDPSLVDINVHPAKLEARFSKEQELLKLVEIAINDALAGQSLIRNAINNEERAKISYQVSEQPSLPLKVNEEQLRSSSRRIIPQEDTSTLSEVPIIAANQDELLLEIDQQFTTTEASSGKLPVLVPLAQFRGTYIIAQGEEGLFLIDQHAAHERINYEKYLCLLDQEQTACQHLLIPINLEFSNSESRLLNTRIAEFHNYGIEIESFGRQSFIVRSTPLWMPKGQEKDLLEQMAQMLLSDNTINEEALRKDLIAEASCKNSIKANKSLTLSEMESLIVQLGATQNPFSCPHGRPVIVHFSVLEIEKLFKRVV